MAESIVAEEIKQKFRRKLSDLASKLGSENLSSLKFLNRDIIPARPLENVTSAEDLFKELEQRCKIGPYKLELLVGQLKRIGRDDLATELECFCSSLEGRSEELE